MDSRRIALDAKEAMLVESILKPSAACVDSDTPSMLPSKDMVLKVGAVMREALESSGSVEVTFTEPELWILRERVSVFDSLGDKGRIGLEIKLRLYAALLSIANSEGDDLPDAEDTTITKSEVSNALRDWDDEAGPAGPDADPADDGAGAKPRAAEAAGAEPDMPGPDQKDDSTPGADAPLGPVS